jgi:hypothetical protein
MHLFEVVQPSELKWVDRKFSLHLVLCLQTFVSRAHLVYRRDGKNTLADNGLLLCFH